MYCSKLGLCSCSKAYIQVQICLVMSQCFHIFFSAFWWDYHLLIVHCPKVSCTMWKKNPVIWTLETLLLFVFMHGPKQKQTHAGQLWMQSWGGVGNTNCTLNSQLFPLVSHMEARSKWRLEGHALLGWCPCYTTLTWCLCNICDWLFLVQQQPSVPV